MAQCCDFSRMYYAEAHVGWARWLLWIYQRRLAAAGRTHRCLGWEQHGEKLLLCQFSTPSSSISFGSSPAVFARCLQLVSQQDCNNDMELGKATSITGDRALIHSQHGPRAEGQAQGADQPQEQSSISPGDHVGRKGSPKDVSH